MVPFKEIVFLPDEDRFEEQDQVPVGTQTATLSGTEVIIATGYVNGILMGNPGHRKGDEAVVAQWTKARELWPSVPFFSRTASFNFTDSTFVESGKNADDLTRCLFSIN